ncbi:hypothetical protein CJ739_1827 [Mariniflexile rhizosphaerae]|nr:hypothetical protein CJ739_1827 [Mariniflexile sp. TRM1-10]PLB20013.1 MAG: hypothetical protein TRG1_1277 [Flavobacteriaceae bacterium FS1-H7996/R]
MNKDKNPKDNKKPKEKPLIIKGTLDDVLKASVKKPKDKK